MSLHSPPLLWNETSWVIFPYYIYPAPSNLCLSLSSMINNVRSYFRLTEVAPLLKDTKVLMKPPPKNGIRSSLRWHNFVSGSNPFREKAHWPPILPKHLWPVIMVLLLAIPILCINIQIPTRIRWIQKRQKRLCIPVLKGYHPCKTKWKIHQKGMRNLRSQKN